MQGSGSAPAHFVPGLLSCTEGGNIIIKERYQRKNKGGKYIMSIFDDVKERISAEQAAIMYGLPVRQHKTKCCFHNERTPSMVFKGQNFHCFGCGAHGSAIDLAMQLFELSPRDAAMKLAEDFGVPVEKSIPSGSNMIRMDITKDELSLLGIEDGRPFEIQVNVEDNGDPVYATFSPPTLQETYRESPSFVNAFIAGRAEERKGRCESMMRMFNTHSEWDASMREVIRYFMIELTDIIARFGGRTMAEQA